MFFTPCVLTQNTQTFQENPIMDEKRIGPNINTIPEQRAVRGGSYLIGKAVVLRLPHPGFKSCCGQCGGTPTWVGAQRQIIFSHFFFFCCGCFDFVPFPREPHKHRGYVGIPLLGPREGRGYAATESGILKKGMV